MSSWMMISRASLLAAGSAAMLCLGGAFAQDEIEVQSLDALDPFEVGLPDAWLGPTLWDGTDAGMAGALFERLPDANSGDYDSAAVAELARAVLSTGGYPPRGGRGNGALAAQRADRLLAAAGAEDAYDLLERTPNINQSPDLARLHAELAFALADERRACATTTALLSGREQPYWVRARAYCLLLDGQGAAAELSAELARSLEPDSGFDDLLFSLSLDRELEGALPALDSGLKLAMARRVRTAESEIAVPAETAPLWLRNSAGGRSAAFDASLNPAATLEDARAQDGDLRTRMLEAVLAQGADRELAAEALGLLLDDARRAGRFVSAARRYGHDVDTIPITRSTLRGGYEFALAALMVGDVGVARRWRDALLDGPPRPAFVAPAGLDKPGLSPEAAEAEVEAWESLPPRQLITLDLAIAVGGDRLRGGQVDALLAAYLEGRGAAALPELLALTRLGALAPDGLSVLLLESDGSSSGALAAMDVAIASNARAEAALLAVSALSPMAIAADAETETTETEATPVTPSPDSFARAVAALDAVEMRDAALYIVLEQIVQGAV